MSGGIGRNKKGVCMKKKTMIEGGWAWIFSRPLFKGAIAANATVFVLLCGCATKEMKSTPFYEGSDISYTGNPEDRINVWPVAYWREPVGSVLWPLTSFSDDQFALRPVYSQYRQDGKDGAFDEFNFLWPLCQADLKGRDYRIFPFFWGMDAETNAYQTVFPVYWNGAGYNSLFPLWIYRHPGRERHLSVLSGMAGIETVANGTEANWCFPLWYWNSKGTFVATLYGRWRNGWAVPPLLSWGESETNGDHYARCLLGLGGMTRCGRRLKHWAWPLYSREDTAYASSNQTAQTHLIMNFAGWKTRNDDMHWSYVFPLYGWEKDKWALTPLSYWDAKGSLFTPLGGRTVDSGATNIFFTPLARATYGSKTGGHLFPLWSRTVDSDFRTAAAKMDSTRLPDDIRVWTQTTTNEVWNETKKLHEKAVRTQRRATSVTNKDRSDYLTLFPRNETVRGQLGFDSQTNRYELTHTLNWRGDIFLPLFSYGYERKVTFSALDRTKESDTETVDASLLLWLYRYGRIDGDSRHRVLWRLWDWNRTAGAVSLDVFPGFTYDEKEDGYFKTSFLWRFFRYEKDPGKGTSVDFLFIPVWR